MIKVSIVIPCLNSATYLSECMDSLIGQTLSEIEILFVDAGSTDGTLEIMKSYVERDKRIKILHSEKKSVGYQYNMGIKAATGKYIGFCEPDDYISREMYETLFSKAEETNADLVKADFRIFMGNGKERIYLDDYSFPGKYNDLLGQIVDIHDYKDIILFDSQMVGGIYRRDFLEQHAIRCNETKGAAFQDTGFTLQANMFSRKYVHIKRGFYNYRRDNATSSVYSQKAIKFALDEFEYICRIMDEHKELNLFRGTICRHCTNVFLSKYDLIVRQNIEDTSTDELLGQFRDILARELDKADALDLYSAGILNDLRINTLLGSVEDYKTYAKYRIINERKTWDYYLGRIVSCDNVVIVGCGQLGKSNLALICRKNINNSVCFTDNNADIWDTEFSGHMIVSPEKAVADHPEGLFIICIMNQYQQSVLKEQFVRLGVNPDNIIISPPLGTRMSMDMSGF